MHALTLEEGTSYKVWFGGSYDEHWSEDYSLFISYRGRRFVTARLTGESWIPAGGDPQLCAAIVSAPRDGMIRRYFNAAVEVYAASQECLRRSVPLTQIYELFSFTEPLAAPELLRLLMDDCGFRFEAAFPAVMHSCKAGLPTVEEQLALRVFQPRTARLTELLRGAKENLLCVEHDGSRREFRDPPRALRCGETVRIAFRLLSGRIEDASLCVFGDRGRISFPMKEEGDGLYSVVFRVSDRAEALWYSICMEASEGYYYICPDETGCFGEVCGIERGGFRMTVYRADFETPEWFRHAVMYQVFPDRFAFSDDGTAEKGIAYHLALGQKSELHKSLDEPLRWQARPGENGYAPDDFYGGTLRGMSIRSSARTRILSVSPRRRKRTASASSSTAYIPTRERTASISTATAAIPPSAPARGRIRRFTAGTFSAAFRTSIAAGGASRTCRRWTSATPPGRRRSSKGKTASSDSGCGAAPPAGGSTWRTNCPIPFCG